MPTIELDPDQVMALQRVLRQNGIEPPDERPTIESYCEANDREMDADAAEAYPSATAEERVLYDIIEACPVCGSTACDESVNWVGSTPIHASEHPENKGRRKL